MYSVLIQNSKTMESFHQFRPLFFEALKDGKLDVCQWFEAGESIETALPEIYRLTRDKERWKAVIVRFEDEEPMSAFDTTPDNPYDFLINQDSDLRVRESEIPLIRLTHMLAGLPSPNVYFSPELIHEPNKAPRMVYRPSVLEEDIKIHAELSERYHFYGPPPSEILMVSLTKSKDARVDQIKRVWSQHSEIDSSEFWKRNAYPSICRFLYYEVERQGPVKNTEDLFKAWTTVLLLATNTVDPSMLQAYKLNRVDIRYDSAKMKECFQNTFDRAVSAREFIMHSIQLELEQRINDRSMLPDYRLNAPVSVDLPANQDFHVPESEFRLVSRTANSDMEQWETMRRKARETVYAAQKAADRALDRTAERMRKYCLYTSAEIEALDAYQMEDMDEELSGIHEEVFEQRTELSGFQSSDGKKLSQAEAGVFRILRTRLTRHHAFRCLIGFLLLLLISALPQIWYYAHTGYEKLSNGISELLIALAVIATVFLIQLLLQRSALRRQITEFNACTDNAITRIGVSAENYSEYMSSIASYIHGTSYLRELRIRHIRNDEDESYKRNHIAALNAFLTELKEWAVAFHLPVSFESAGIRDDIELNTELAPSINPLYTFEEINDYPVDINGTGNSVECPFGFVKEFIIQREELFDDAE